MSYEWARSRACAYCKNPQSPDPRLDVWRVYHCPNHCADEKPSRRTFGRTGATKRWVRRSVYETARTFTKRVDEARVLMLPGGEPAHEAALARAVFPGACVVAFDTDARTLPEASKHVDVAVHADVGDLRFHKASADPRVLTNDYIFANLDFCGLVTSKGLARAADRARMMSQAVATWFSFGHEQRLSAVHEYARTVTGRTTGSWLDHHLSALPVTVRARLLYFWNRIAYDSPTPAWAYAVGVGPVNMRAVKVWTYRDQAMPMMCVLWSCNPQIDLPDLLPYENVGKIGDERFRTIVLAEADAGVDVGLMLGIGSRQLAAWRAVRTKRLATHSQKETC